MDLQHDLIAILGMHAPRPLAIATADVEREWAADPPEFVEARPVPQYRYRLDVSRPEYGCVYVTAGDGASKNELLTGVDWNEIDWVDSGDLTLDDWSEEECINADETEAWDSLYADRYDPESGVPICRICYQETLLSDLLAHEWLCTTCQRTSFYSIPQSI
jgi:hypothetical protein